ncbi:dethiobiotin synthase [Psychrosphaera aquimarina]|uniref:ATP-dependent dethiobiotin synthetase BioD n=1 Tax=Psychrosphaera aquimarina TaxID=2044854 RepID=A0ABU3QWN1_9GAMM|nr:dethiobiotin synthase [Psychrosphaera aquimarina]MDU0111829.1 dethiobiotin synthase [Psychrosphaera aquimarina]
MNISTLFNQHKTIFITGTDTEVGKTFCASLMVKALLKDNLDIFPFKPISAGTQYYPELEASNNTMANEDAVCLYNAVQRRYSLDQINPIVFDQPIAPHIAAKMAQQALDFNRLDIAYKGIKDLGEVQLIEGAGGWHLPLNDSELLSEWVAQHQLPVIMVVGVKLGCLNHALLTAQAIEQSGCNLIGWIANYIEGDSDIAKQNVAFIKQKLNAPLIHSVQQGQTELV